MVRLRRKFQSSGAELEIRKPAVQPRQRWSNPGRRASGNALLTVTRQLVDQATLSLNLAQTRYQLGLGSIVELSQAQLEQTQAEIRNVQSDYDYRLRWAVLRYQTASF